MRPAIVAVGLFLFSLPAMAAPPVMRNPQPLPKRLHEAEYPPLEIQVGDFGGDSANDILSVVAGDSIQVIVNEADGITGDPVVSPIAEGGIRSAATGDLDGDGDLDVAMSLSQARQIVTYLNNGSGTFTRGTIISGEAGGNVAIADFNRDGRGDLALVCDSEVRVFAGVGAGSFASPIVTVMSALSGAAGDVDVVDANGDGKSDLLIRAGSTVIALGHGDGTFVVASAAPPGRDVATGDFNGDGAVDFALSVENAPSTAFVAVYRGVGNGTFALAGKYDGLGYHALTAADIDSDGRQDLVSGSQYGKFAVLRGNGDATFDEPELWHTGYVWDIVAGDFTRDGHADIVMMGGLGSETIQMIAGTGPGEFATYRAFLPGGARAYTIHNPAHAWGPMPVDMNNDGAPDLVTVLTPNHNEEEVSVMLNANDGRGTMKAPVITRLPYDNLSVSVGDVNGDGKGDIVTASLDRADPWGNLQPGRTYLGRGDGTFEPPREFPLPQHQRPGPALLDVTGDGVLDLIFGGWIHRGGNDGTFSSLVQFDFPFVRWGDLNGDGRVDFVGEFGYRSTTVAINDGDGTSFTITTTRTGSDYSGSSMGPLADMNGDGALDMVMHTSYWVMTFLGNGDGTFDDPVYFSLRPSFQYGPTTGDFDGDGMLDVADGPAVYLGHGDGTFDGYARVQTHWALGARAADFDGNGTDDLALGSGDDAVSIILTSLGSEAPQTVTMTLTTSPNPSKHAAVIEAVAKVGVGANPKMGALVFAVDDKPFALHGDTQVTEAHPALARGTRVISATYTGDDRIAPVTASVQQVVEQAPTTVFARAYDSSVAACGAEVRVLGGVNAAQAPGLPGPPPVTWWDGTQPLTVTPKPEISSSLFGISGLSVGWHTITVDFPGDANYAPSSKSFTLQITPSIDATITAGGAVYPSQSGFASARTYEGATYAWTIDNGTIDSGQGTPQIRYTAGPSGSVTLGLSITRTSCGDTRAHTTTIVAQDLNATMFHLLPPCRVVDTRYTTPLAGGATRELPLANLCGIPADAKTLAVNLTVVSPPSVGWLSLFAADTAWPRTSTLNYRSGRTRANAAIVPVSPGARLKVLNDGPAVHFVIDVLGFFR